MGNTSTTFNFKEKKDYETFEANLYLNDDQTFKFVSHYTSIIGSSSEKIETTKGTFRFEKEKVILKPFTIDLIHQTTDILGMVFGTQWKQNGSLYVQNGEWYINNDVYMHRPGHYEIKNKNQNVKLGSDSYKIRLEVLPKETDTQDVKQITEINLLQYFKVDIGEESLFRDLDPLTESFPRNIKLKKNN